MNDILMRKNEEWMQSKEDYLTMVTSPDFQNLNVSLYLNPTISLNLGLACINPRKGRKWKKITPLLTHSTNI